MNKDTFFSRRTLLAASGLISTAKLLGIGPSQAKKPTAKAPPLTTKELLAIEAVMGKKGTYKEANGFRAAMDVLGKERQCIQIANGNRNPKRLPSGRSYEIFFKPRHVWFWWSGSPSRLYSTWSGWRKKVDQWRVPGRPGTCSACSRPTGIAGDLSRLCALWHLRCRACRTNLCTAMLCNGCSFGNGLQTLSQLVVDAVRVLWRWRFCDRYYYIELL